MKVDLERVDEEEINIDQKAWNSQRTNAFSKKII